MIPLKITAKTPAGFAASDKWSPSLDGILAYWYMHEQLGDEAFALGQGRTDLMTPVEGLPLEVIHHNGWSWYAASSPIIDPVGVYQRYYHRRFDAEHEQYLSMPGKSQRVQTNAGPYKNYRRSVLVSEVREVIWHVVGLKGEIQRLISRCTHIGHKSAQGYGKVSEWIIDDSGSREIAYYHRPIPVVYAQENEAMTNRVMQWGLRPPGRLPENQTLCVMPN